jgi:hypothetical protein
MVFLGLSGSGLKPTCEQLKLFAIPFTKFFRSLIDIFSERSECFKKSKKKQQQDFSQFFSLLLFFVLKTNNKHLFSRAFKGGSKGIENIGEKI